MSVDRLFGERKFCYMWTFTFREVYNVDEAFTFWAKLSQELVRRFGLLFLRVAEMHPGGHGTHFHILCRKWFPVQVLRRVARCCGFTGVHILKTTKSSYLAKYVANKERNTCLKRRRVWAACGGREKYVDSNGKKRSRTWACRVRDLEVVTRRHEIFRALSRVAKATGRAFGPRERLEAWLHSSRLEIEEIVAGRFIHAGDSSVRGGAVVCAFGGG